MTRRRRGQVVKAAKGYYAVASFVGDDGKRTRPRVGPFTTQRDAQDALDDLVVDIRRGTFAQDDRTPLVDYLRAWLRVHVVTLKPSTAHGYATVVERYVAASIGGIPLADLRPSHLSALYASLVKRGLSPRTVRTVHVVVRRALADAVREGTLGRNVAAAAALPRVGHVEQAAWSADEARGFLDATRDDRMHALFVIALSTGMRRGELAGLRWDDVDLQAATVTVKRTRTVVGRRVVEGEPKTATSRRVIDIDPGTVSALRRLRVAQGPGATLVFTVHPDDISRAWNQAVRRAGVRRIRFHDARHTAASLMLQAGVPVNVVSRRLGHTSPVVTLSIYSHVLPGQGRDAADRLGAALGTDGASG
jgi:integrase